DGRGPSGSCAPPTCRRRPLAARMPSRRAPGRHRPRSTAVGRPEQRGRDPKPALQPSALFSVLTASPRRARCILNPMPRGASVALLAVVVLAGCASTRVAFPNVTPGAPLRVPGWELRPAGEGPFPAVVAPRGGDGVSESSQTAASVFDVRELLLDCSAAIERYTQRIA